MATKTFTVTKQYMADTTDQGNNPGDLHIVIGRWQANSFNTRACLYAPVSFSGMTAINSARLYLRANAPSSGFHTKGTTTTDINARRKTADWSETSGGASSAVDESWGGGDHTVVTANFAGQISNDGIPVPSLTDAAWYYIPITGIVKLWFDGSPNYGVMVYNDGSETNSSYSKQFWSRHASGSQPYIWIDYETNTAPNAPTSMSPTGNAVVNTGTTITYTLTHSDPDGSSDTPSGAEYRIYTDAGTQIDTWSSGATSTNTRSTNRTLPSGYKANTYYKWAARTKDKAGVWGPWSAQQRFRPNSVPNAPTGMSEELDSQTPTFSGSFSDPDPNDTLTAVEIEVNNYTTGALVWDSGSLSDSGSTWSKVCGATLAWGTKYKWRARVKDAVGAWSAFSGYRIFTPTQPAGPTQTPRSTTYGSSVGGKQATTSPVLTVSRGTSFINHQVNVYVNNTLGTPIYSYTGANYAAATSKTVTPTGLTNGRVYYWTARVLDTDGVTWSAWAGLSTVNNVTTVTSAFYINALPTAPTNLEIIEDTGAPVVARDSDGVHMVTNLTPVFLAKYNDPDLLTYNDLPGNRDIEIANDATGAAVSTLTNIATVFGDPVQYRLATVTARTTTSAASVAGATNIKFASATNLAVNDIIMIGPHGNTQEARKIVTLGTVGSGGTGITMDRPLQYDHASGEAIAELTPLIAMDTIYKIRTRFKDNTGNYGAWSNYLRFKATTPSVASNVTPTGTITSPSVNVAWDLATSGGKAQGKYRVQVVRNADEATVYDSGFVASATKSHLMPAGHLQNSNDYTIVVEALDTDNM